MPKNIPRTGKRDRAKTSVKGKRYLCAKCRKRSPKPVKHSAPWYCPRCLAEKQMAQAAFDQHQPEVVVGASRARAEAVNLNSGSARVVPCRPSWND